MQNNPGPKPCNLVPKTLTTTPQPTTMCNRVQPCATYSCAPHNHVQPCATMCHHVQPRATMCNAPMCYPCAQPCATMCTHVQCTDVLPMCTLCKAPMCHDITIHELLHVKLTSNNKITTLQTPAPVPAPKTNQNLTPQPISTKLNQSCIRHTPHGFHIRIHFPRSNLISIRRLNSHIRQKISL